MLAYKAIETLDKEDTTAGSTSHIDRLAHKLIEKCVKTYKCHRSALDTDLKFVKELQMEVGVHGVKFLQAVVKKMNSFR